MRRSPPILEVCRFNAMIAFIFFKLSIAFIRPPSPTFLASPPTGQRKATCFLVSSGVSGTEFALNYPS